MHNLGLLVADENRVCLCVEEENAEAEENVLWPLLRRHTITHLRRDGHTHDDDMLTRSNNKRQRHDESPTTSTSQSWDIWEGSRVNKVKLTP